MSDEASSAVTPGSWDGDTLEARPNLLALHHFFLFVEATDAQIAASHRNSDLKYANQSTDPHCDAMRTVGFQNFCGETCGPV